MKDNQTYRGSRIEKAIRGYPGIYRISIWDEEKRKYMDPRFNPGLNQQPFRAKKRIKTLGKWIQVSECFDSVEEARAWRQDSNVEPSKRRLSTYVIRQLIEDWRNWSRTSPRMHESTWSLYGKDLRHIELLFDIPVNELASEDIDAWLTRLKDPSYPKPATRISFQREVKTLRTILNWYREYKNPRYQSPYLRRHLKDAIWKRKPIQVERALNWEDLEKFLSRLRTHHRPVYYYLAAFQALTGARIGEACGLQWDCVDLLQARVQIRRIIWWDYRTKGPKLREGTKTGENRVVLLPARLVEILREWRANGSKGSFVFHKEGEPLRYPAIQNAYNKALIAEGLSQRSTHFLRHTFAKLHADQTRNMRATQAALGHRSSSMTDHYAHVNEETQADALKDFRVGQFKPVDSETKPTLQ